MHRASLLAGESAAEVENPHARSEGDLQLIGLAVRGNADPGEVVVSAFDLERWLEGLPDSDLRLLELRAEGYTLQEIATRQGTSISVVFARCQRLGVQLAEAADVARAHRRG